MLYVIGLFAILIAVACTSSSSYQPELADSTNISTPPPSSSEQELPPETLQSAERADSYVSDVRREQTLIIREDYDFLRLVREGRIDQVSILLRGDNRDQFSEMKTEDGNNALHVAAFYGQDEIAGLLLSYKLFDPNVLNENKQTPLQVAVAQREEDVFLLLYETGEVDLNNKDINGNTAFHQAILIGHEKIFNKLISSEIVDINLKNNQGFSALHLASKIGNSDFVSALIRNKADLNSTSLNNWTPLHIAAYEGEERIVNLLVEAGANPDIRSRYRLLAYHLAVQKGHADTAMSQILFNIYNGELDRYRQDWSLLHKAIYNNWHKEDVDALIFNYNSEQVNEKDGNDWTPMHWAVFRNSEISIVEALMNQGAKITQQGKYGTTAFHWAVRLRHKKALRLFLQRRAVDVNIVDNVGNSPLHWAAEIGDPDTIRLLINYNANIFLNNTYGEKPRDIARGRGHPQRVWEEL